MHEQTNSMPRAPDSIEALLGAPFSMIIQNWESIQPLPNPDPDLVARYPAILSAADELTHHPKLIILRKAIMARNEHALNALVLASCLFMTCDTLLERCTMET